jgi:hypothetical protein
MLGTTPIEHITALLSKNFTALTLVELLTKNFSLLLSSTRDQDFTPTGVVVAD